MSLHRDVLTAPFSVVYNAVAGERSARVILGVSIVVIVLVVWLVVRGVRS